ncbi:MAG: Internalin-A [Chlamydiae bacterium]|nr:Internalin-A [Chlamydiota bacterium]
MESNNISGFPSIPQDHIGGPSGDEAEGMERVAREALVSPKRHLEKTSNESGLRKKKRRISESIESHKNIRSQLEALGFSLSDILKELSTDPRLTIGFRSTIAGELEFIGGVDKITDLPVEILCEIFTYLPEDHKAFSQANTKIHWIAQDNFLKEIYSKTRLQQLESAFKESGFSERWEAHLNIVKCRLQANGKNISSRNIYNELIQFQMERFPSSPFENDSNPYTVEGFLEREKIIKNWNFYIFVKKIFPGNPFLPPILPPINEITNKWNLDFIIEQARKLRLPVLMPSSVNLRNLELTEIPEEVRILGPTIRKIDFSSNLISYIPKNCFSVLTSLQKLWLNDNQITAIDKEAFSGLTNLQNLWLNNNQIALLDKEIFSALTSLQELWLSDNKIASLDKEIFSGLTSLQKLWLNNNQIASLDKEIFSGLTSLQVLCLRNNQIASLDKEIFSALTSLLELWLHNNQIASLDKEIFSGLTSLQKLLLSNNKIASFDKEIFSGLTSLQKLYLDNDQMSLIDYETFSRINCTLVA